MDMQELESECVTHGLSSRKGKNDVIQAWLSSDCFFFAGGLATGFALPLPLGAGLPVPAPLDSFAFAFAAPFSGTGAAFGAGGGSEAAGVAGPFDSTGLGAASGAGGGSEAAEVAALAGTFDFAASFSKAICACGKWQGTKIC